MSAMPCYHRGGYHDDPHPAPAQNARVDQKLRD